MGHLGSACFAPPSASPSSASWPGEWTVERDQARHQATVHWSGKDSSRYPWGTQTDVEKLTYKTDDAHPDISSVEAFKRALLNAKSIALADPAGGGPVGIYATSLFERLGVSAAVTPKLKLVGGGLAPVEPVAKGDAEIGLTTISEILPVPGIELVGPLPREIQTFIVFTAAIPANAKEPMAAKALIDFLSSPRATSPSPYATRCGRRTERRSRSGRSRAAPVRISQLSTRTAQA